MDREEDGMSEFPVLIFLPSVSYRKILFVHRNSTVASKGAAAFDLSLDNHPLRECCINLLKRLLINHRYFLRNNIFVLINN